MSDIRESRLFSKFSYSPKGWLAPTVLILGDIIGLGTAWYIAETLNSSFSSIPSSLFWGEFLGFTNVFWVFTLLTILVFSIHNFYSQESQWRSYVKQTKALSSVYITSLVLSYCYDPQLNLPRSLFFPAWIGSIVMVLAMRFCTTLLLQQLRIYQAPLSLFLIASPDRESYLRDILEKRSNSIVTGFLKSDRAYNPDTINLILQSGATTVVAEQLPETLLASDLYWQLRQHQIELRLFPSSLVTLHRRGEQEIFVGLPIIRIEPQWIAGWEYTSKRFLDVALSLAGIILLSPIFILVIAGICLSSPGNAFYFQERVGLHGKVFWMWKFRSMFVDADRRQSELEKLNNCQDGVMFKLKNDPRIFTFGRFIRRTSIDELPQLFNVLLGQMSLVGPRPLPVRDVSRFADWHHDRHLVMPGITGLWQISGRSNLDSIDDAVRLDFHYIDNWSLNLDLQILLETVRIVLFGQGAY